RRIPVSFGFTGFPARLARHAGLERWGEPHSTGSGEHGELEALLPGALPGDVVAGVGVAHHAGARVVPQHAGDAAVGGLAAVADDDHAAVLAVTHADAAAVVQRHPGGAAGDVEHGVEQRPVGDRIGAVGHRLGLA